MTLAVPTSKRSESAGSACGNPPEPAGPEHNVRRVLARAGRDYASTGTPQRVTG
jgi:hypothetical protein